MDEHRLIMEGLLGRKLQRNEVVHHINGNTKDNRVENLQVMTLSEHSRLHFPHGQPMSDKARQQTSERFKGKPKYYCTKYTKEQITDWYSKKSQGIPLRQIERETGVNHGTISNVLNGKVLAYREILDQLA